MVVPPANAIATDKLSKHQKVVIVVAYKNANYYTVD